MASFDTSGTSKASIRGSSVSIRRSLRVRIISATGLAFVGLGLIVCLILPRSFQQQARSHLRERTAVLARGVTDVLQRELVRSGTVDVSLVADWLSTEPDLEACALLDADGNVLDGWPGPTAGWGLPIPERLALFERSDHFLAVAPLVGGDGPPLAIGIRTTTDGLRSQLADVLWLFVSILLLTMAGFVVLATYLARGILDPLEEIRKAAMELADGEPLVKVPVSGDLEIDELGSFIEALGAKRRHSTVMQSPFVRREKSSVAPPQARTADKPEKPGSAQDPSAASGGPPATSAARKEPEHR